jgi:hypothetical protein
VAHVVAGAVCARGLLARLGLGELEHGAADEPAAGDLVEKRAERADPHAGIAPARQNRQPMLIEDRVVGQRRAPRERGHHRARDLLARAALREQVIAREAMQPLCGWIPCPAREPRGLGSDEPGLHRTGLGEAERDFDGEGAHASAHERGGLEVDDREAAALGVVSRHRVLRARQATASIASSGRAQSCGRGAVPLRPR